MNPRTLLRFGGPIVLAAGVAACGNPAPTPSPASAQPSVASSAGSVCGMVADMDELVGRTAAAPPSSYTVGSSERCLWVYVTDPSRYVALTVGEASSHAATTASFGEGEPVEGVGAEARWWAANKTLSVLDGEGALQVDIQLDDAPDPKALAVSIAQAALGQRP